MDNIKIEPTSNTPTVDFNFAENRLYLGGESFSEEVAVMFDGLFEKIKLYLSEGGPKEVELVFEWVYFNSFSSRKIFQLLTMMDEAADEGHSVTITWCYRSFDDNMLEFGEEFGEDIENAKFVLKEIPEEE